MAQASLSVPPPKPLRVGRPTLLTPELQEGICDLIRKGNRPAEAAQCFGLTGESHREWIRRGRTGTEPFASYAVAVNSALADAKEGLVAIMRRAAESDPKHWKAAQAILERFDPKPAASASSGPFGSPMTFPSAVRLDDEAFWTAFEKDTAQRVAMLEERRRILAERKQQSLPETAGSGSDRG